MNDETTFIHLEEISTSAPVTDVFITLEQVARRLSEIQRLTVSQANLTPPQFQTLRLLWEQDR